MATDKCPVCGSHKISEDDFTVLDCYRGGEFIGTQIDHEMACNACDHHWIDRYPTPCESDDCECHGG